MTAARSFAILCTIGVLCFISYNMVRMPVLALFAQRLGAGPEAIGLIVSVSTLTGVLLKLPSGALSDIYGRTLLLRIGVLAFGLPPFLYPFVHEPETLTLLRLVHGLATAIFAPSALATVAHLYQARRGAAMGTYTACTQSGALLGPLIGGWLVVAMGFNEAFLTAGGFGLLAVLLFFSLHIAEPPPRIAEKGLAPVLREMWNGFVIVARNRRVLVTSATDGAKMIANGALMAFLPLYGASVGLTPWQTGLLFSVQALTSFFSKPVMGRVSDRVGRTPLILTGLLICAGTFVAIPHVSWLFGLLILASGFGFGEAVVTSSTAAFVADLSALKQLGAAMGMQGTIGDIGHAAGPLLAGLLIARLDYADAFAIIAGLQLVAAGLFWLTMRGMTSPGRTA